MLIMFFLVGALAVSVPVNSQDVSDPAEETYIPTDLEDCFSTLDSLLSPEDIQTMKAGTEDDMIQYHFGLGMWMRNNCGLWGGSRLAKWFNGIGINHPDDMSGIILDSNWRYLNSRPIELDDQVSYYQKYWEQLEADGESDP